MTADQSPDRRERYAEALYATQITSTRHPWTTLSPLRRSVWYRRAEAAMAIVDAEPAVSPTRTDILRGAADVAERIGRAHSYTDNDLGITDAITAELRRMAGEEQPAGEAEAHPAEHTWAAEMHDPLADEWVPGTRYIDRDRAVNHLAHANAIGPRWKDGTPVERRLVRATTTYTVEQPAAEAQQDGAAS